MNMSTMYERRRAGLLGVLLAGIVLCTTSVAHTSIVLNFDDLPDHYTLTGSGYGGVEWEQGDGGYWGTYSEFSYPSSPPRNAETAASRIGVRFSSPATVDGAYFAAAGNLRPPYVWAEGYLNGEYVSYVNSVHVSDTPLWVDLTGLGIVDRVVFAFLPTPGAFGLDDLTFTYVPEPAGISLGLLALGGMLLRRRHRH